MAESNRERAERVLETMYLKRVASKKRNKTEDVLRYLVEKKDGVTSYEAFEKFDSVRLGSIIHEIETTHRIVLHKEDEYHNGTKYRRYTLEEADYGRDMA